MSLVDRTRLYAIENHNNANDLYDTLPYSNHLTSVYEYVKEYEHLLPEHKRETAEATAWAHDLLKGNRVSFKDLYKFTNEDVAEAVYAITPLKGRNEEEKENDTYFKDLLFNEVGHFVKICERLADAKYASKENKTEIFKEVHRSNTRFVEKLQDDRFTEMFEELNDIIYTYQIN